MQNVRVTAFTVSELLRENQQGQGGAGGDHPDYGYQSNIYLFKVNTWKTRKRC